jgi:hypothetical protein
MYLICTSGTDTTAIVSIDNQKSFSFIPIDDNNIDYLAYVAWLFDGNTPEEWNPEVTQPDMEEGN